MNPSNFYLLICKKKLVIRWRRAGKFLGCEGFPDCKFTKSLTEEDDGVGELMENEPPCEKCGGKMIVKFGRRGKFLACDQYPECKNTKSIPTKHSCPNEGCDGKIVQRHSKRGRRFFGCSKYPDCDYTSSKLPEEEDEGTDKEADKETSEPDKETDQTASLE